MPHTNKLDTEFIPSSLLKEAREVLGEDLTRLTHRHQVGYVEVFWNNYGITRNNQHSKQLGSFKMSRKDINRFFVDQKNFRALNDNGYYLGFKNTRHGLSDKISFSRRELKGFTKRKPTRWVKKTFEAHGGSKSGGRYAGYQLAPRIVKMMDEWAAKAKEVQDNPQGMINYKGERIEAVADYHGGGIIRHLSSTPESVNVNLLVRIDTEALNCHRTQLELVRSRLEAHKVDTLAKDDGHWLEVRSKLESLNQEAQSRAGLVGVKVQYVDDKPLESLFKKALSSDGINQRITEINRLLIISSQMVGHKVPVVYHEVGTGRYHSNGSILQGYHKSVRYAALKGCYEYDLEAAHQNILVQLLDRIGASFKELDVVREYISNKAEIRIRLAQELNTTVAIVKVIIQELTYGAKLYNHSSGAIFKTCDGNYQLIERIVNNPWLVKLALCFSIAHKHLVGDDKQVANAVGINVESIKKSKDMAHILQGYERQILDSLIAHCNRKDMALLLHDCVVFYNKQSSEELSLIVREKTGFNLKFSEEKY
jgi:hypothetical protein